MFAVGGYDRGHCLNLVECFDQEKNEWVPTTPLTSARGRLGLSCLNGKVLFIFKINFTLSLCSLDQS